MGARGVELDARTEVRPAEMSQTAVRQLRKLFDELNLKVCAVSFLTRRGYDASPDMDRRVAATKQAMKMAYELGADLVINHVGRVPAAPAEGAEPSEAWRNLQESLSELGRYGVHVGARLAAEASTDSGADLARLIAALPPGALGVSLNPGRLLANGHSPLEVVAALGRDIVHVHATDAVQDAARGHGGDVPLGRGMVDYPALLGALEEHNYRGYFTIERRGSPDPIFEIGQAVKYLQSL